MYNIELVSFKDLYNFALINLDYKTESFTSSYYNMYLLFHTYQNIKITLANSNIPAAYIFAKNEFNKAEKMKYTHITAISVAPMFRRCGFGTILMDMLTKSSVKNYSFYIDLFVRRSNLQAIGFYKKLGYKVHQVCESYYDGPCEDAFDMRKYLNE
ncbi:hypothetical protein EDEG_01111 [Edhazardia aedis USNM 41457]|uniref:N-acetyltransferase domain-containing protein n=1 Tax=Edhazardia aedis (strain USNM 41457) TaxID=1003232 RepID=J8ZYG7_EDHAE|nr:hypothetical protein EDEG_01111 [Edhazardia aedis USNM 41457]|eukprot:EJW04698.1 hypothetical protein EDEG_01111 [Edhazardia aedis USNM 41457]